MVRSKDINQTGLNLYIINSKPCIFTFIFSDRDVKLSVYSVSRRRVTRACAACLFVQLTCAFVFHNANVLYDTIHMSPHHEKTFSYTQLRAPVAVQPDLCRPGRKPRLLVFSRRGSYDTTVLLETYFHDDAFLHSFQSNTEVNQMVMIKGKTEEKKTFSD